MDHCEYPVEGSPCGDPQGFCEHGLCDYHCKHFCYCGGFALVEPKEVPVD